PEAHFVATLYGVCGSAGARAWSGSVVADGILPIARYFVRESVGNISQPPGIPPKSRKKSTLCGSALPPSPGDCNLPAPDPPEVPRGPGPPQGTGHLGHDAHRPRHGSGPLAR